MAKPKVGFYWCASCGGCEEAVVDLAENILTVVEAVDIIFWPVALDFKREDIEKMSDTEIDVVFINGAIRIGEQQEMVELLRKKSKLVVAFGSCAHLGGIPGLGNFWNKDSIFTRVYHEVPSLEEKNETIPLEEFSLNGHTLQLPEFFQTVHPLNQVIDVDYYLPGCPPTAELVLNAVLAILKGVLPPRGAVLSPNKSLCDECDRNKTKPEKLLLKDIKRVQEVDLDPEECFLAQGLICMGPATRSGCGYRCLTGNMPCTGCFGPTDGVIDQGAKAISAIASMIDYNNEKEIEKLTEKIVDPAGTFYRYSLPTSLLKRRSLSKL